MIQDKQNTNKRENIQTSEETTRPHQLTPCAPAPSLLRAPVAAAPHPQCKVPAAPVRRPQGSRREGIRPRHTGRHSRRYSGIGGGESCRHSRRYDRPRVGGGSVLGRGDGLWGEAGLCEGLADDLPALGHVEEDEGDGVPFERGFFGGGGSFFG